MVHSLPTLHLLEALTEIQPLLHVKLVNIECYCLLTFLTIVAGHTVTVHGIVFSVVAFVTGGYLCFLGGTFVCFDLLLDNN